MTNYKDRDINQVRLIGNLGQEPVSKKTKNGQDVAELSVATNEFFKKENGEFEQKTQWHRVICYGGCANVASLLKKGQRIEIEGKITSREWTDPTGIKKTITEIIVSGFSGMLRVIQKLEQSEIAPNQKILNGNVDDEIPF